MPSSFLELAPPPPAASPERGLKLFGRGWGVRVNAVCLSVRLSVRLPAGRPVVCMYVRMYVCLYVRMHACLYTSMSVSQVDVYVSVCVYAYVYVYVLWVYK